MRIAILGTGYQGLVTGTCFAENGHRVVCMDRDADRIALLKQGVPPIHEPGLEELIIRNMEEERLSFTNDLANAVRDSLMIFLCIGTPADEQGRTDLSGLFGAVRQIAGAMDGYRIIVNKCTCPPGTADQIEEILHEHAGHPA
ncbi:MAG TPA: UDP-glucose 6-dehydrogenase, partial [Candidatus Hydrogenedentes bacterium]|nr:UDP-glucose 6-dehydrogenase [Candidatus Hydrogenedentota bacterium]